MRLRNDQTPGHAKNFLEPIFLEGPSRRIWEPAFKRQLENLAKETDLEILGRELLEIGAKEAAKGNLELSGRIFAWLAAEGVGEPRLEAQRRIDVSQGKGGSGLRTEYLLEGFFREASDPATLAAMAVGGAVYRGTRIAAMSRLAGRAGIFGRGMGMKLAGGAIGFAAEAPAFTMVGRMGSGRKLSEAGLDEELLSSYLVLGGLKGMGGLVKQVSRGSKNPGLSRWVTLGGMYGGVMMGHALEAGAGLREWRSGGIEWAEGLALLLQLQVSGRLLHMAGGPRHASLELELEYRAERMAEWNSIDRWRAANDGHYLPIEPAANGPHREALAQTWAMASGGETWASAEAEAPALASRFQVFAGRDGSGDLKPRLHEVVQVPLRPIEDPSGKIDIPSHRAKEATRPIDGLVLTSSSPGVGLVKLRVYRPELPIRSHEAIYRVKEIDPSHGVVVMELDPFFNSGSLPAARELLFALNESMAVSCRERFILDVSLLRARELGMPDLAEVKKGKPLEVPQNKNSFFGIGTQASLQDWYGESPVARLAQIDVYRPPGKAAYWTLTFENFEGRGKSRLILVKEEEAIALGLADAAGGMLETAMDRAQELSLVERSPGPTYPWGVQGAARLVSQGMHQLDFTLFLDDLAPMRDAMGRESPFLILGRGETSFGSEYIRDPQVSREHLKIFFPDGYWMARQKFDKKGHPSGEPGFLEIENLSPNLIWTLRPGESYRPLHPKHGAAEGGADFFRKLHAGDKIVFGPYTITLDFRRGLSVAKGEVEVKSAPVFDAPPSRSRPLENLNLEPGRVYELGRNLRPIQEGVVGISISQPFIALRHARLRYERPESGQAGGLWVEPFAEERPEAELAGEFTTADGKHWRAPDLKGLDRDLALPPSNIQDLLSPQLWVYAVGEQGSNWMRLPTETPSYLRPGALLALGRLEQPKLEQRMVIKESGSLGIDFINIPWNLRDAVIYQFAESKQGGHLTLYRFDED